MKTAVELLEEKAMNGFITPEDFEQAKEMEKQQLEKFYNHGQWAIIEHGHGDEFDDYYNKTFKSE